MQAHSSNCFQSKLDISIRCRIFVHVAFRVRVGLIVGHAVVNLLPRVEDVNLETVAKSELPPIEQVNFFGQTRNCIWSTAPVDGVTDELGWQYARSSLQTTVFGLPVLAPSRMCVDAVGNRLSTRQ